MTKRTCSPAESDPLVQAQALLSQTRLTLTDLIAAQRQLTSCFESLRIELLRAQLRASEHLRHP